MNNENTQDQISALARELVDSISKDPIQPETRAKLEIALQKRVTARLLKILIDNLDEAVFKGVQDKITDTTSAAESLEIMAEQIPDFENKVILGLASLHDEIKQDLQDLVDLFQNLEDSKN